MSLLERIKETIFGQMPPPPRTVEEERRMFATAGHADGASRLDVSTPVDDPALDDVAAGGVQPLSKPVEIEDAQNPERRPRRLDT